MRFLIRGPQGEQFELTDASDGPEPVAYFLDEYEPKGFEIVTSPPTGYDVPDLREIKAERKAAAEKAEAEAAERHAIAAKKAAEDAEKRAKEEAEKLAEAAKKAEEDAAKKRAKVEGQS